MKVLLEFGFIAPSLKAQLRKQGLRLKRGHNSFDKTWAEFNRAISTLGLGGLITDREKHSARRKLTLRTLEHIERTAALRPEGEK